jgi:predicted aldo/keto reductase-like oxidoreductase
MKTRQNKMRRREFIKSIGAAGLAPALLRLSEAAAQTDANEPNVPPEKQEQKLGPVPKRKLGKTNAEVSVLALGAMFNLVENQIVLRKALEWGVTYWDTAHGYAEGNSELGIGKFFKQNPETRKDVFIVTKASKSKTIADIEQRLQTSLKRMNTDYIDLYYGVHNLRDPARLTDELRKWAEGAKKRGVIRFFGFSTHKNMAKCLSAAAKTDWIDGILTTYNYRVMHEADLQAAVEACHKAGIGLTAMKTQGKRIKTGGDEKLIEYFVKKGLSEGQAKIKIVLEDERFSSAAVGMLNIQTLRTNTKAVLDKTKLSRTDKKVLFEYAQATCSGYCGGCAEICDQALPNTPYVSDILRYLMYHNSYGDRDRAKKAFAGIPANIRRILPAVNYARAEALCPQHIPIGRYIAEAVNKLA